MLPLINMFLSFFPEFAVAAVLFLSSLLGLTLPYASLLCSAESRLPSCCHGKVAKYRFDGFCNLCPRQHLISLAVVWVPTQKLCYRSLCCLSPDTKHAETNGGITKSCSKCFLVSQMEPDLAHNNQNTERTQKEHRWETEYLHIYRSVVMQLHSLI